MQITEKLDIPFQVEINHLATIQVHQSEHFNLSVSKQFELFKSEYQLTLKNYYSIDQQDLIKKIELVDFMFDVHMQTFDLPKEFQQTFNLLKIVTLKSALYHSAFFSHTHNPIAHYLYSISSQLKQKLHSKNKEKLLKLLKDNVQMIIIKYQSDPSFFDVQTKGFVNALKSTKSLKSAANNVKGSSLKTSYLKDTFSREVTNIKDAASKKNNVFLFTAKNIKKGEWVNLNQNQDTALIKLIWKADDSSEFIFVNKEGEKVRQCNLLELAADLENAIISIITKDKKTKIGRRNDSFLKTIG